MKSDVIIIGGGLVGLVAALALAQQNFSVTVLEAKPLQESLSDPDHSKAFALNTASYQCLQDLGIGEALAPHASPINKVHISEQGKWSRCLIEATAYGLPALGYLIPEAYLKMALQEAVKHHKKITMLHEVTVDQVHHERRTLEFSKQTMKYTGHYHLLIAADGVNSSIRERFNIPIVKKYYQQTALVTRVTITESHENMAYERFTSQGTLALLPVSEKRCALIITGDDKKIARWQKLNDQAFLAELQRLFGFRLGRFLSITARLTFPLIEVIAKEQVKEGVVIVGNAAHLLHPVAAQGFNLSVQDITVLVDHLVQSRMREEDYASIVCLQRYAEARKKAQARSRQLTHGIVTIFSSDWFPVKKLRHWGLLGLECLPFAKRAFVRQTTGLGEK